MIVRVGEFAHPIEGLGCLPLLTHSLRANIKTQNLAGLAFCGNEEGTAANFAIRGEGLRVHAGINHQFKGLAAIGALDGFGNLHFIVKQGNAGWQKDKLILTLTNFQD